MIHLESWVCLFLRVYRVKEIPRWIFLYMSILKKMVVAVPFAERTAFHVESPWQFCQKSICHIYVGLLLDYCFIYSCFFLCQHHTIFWFVLSLNYFSFMSWGQIYKYLNPILLFQNCFVSFRSLQFLHKRFLVFWLGLYWIYRSTWVEMIPNHIESFNPKVWCISPFI